MNSESKIYYPVLILFFIFSGLAIYNLAKRPALPFILKESEKGIQISQDLRSHKPSNLEGLVIEKAADLQVSWLYQIDEVADRRHIGDSVAVRLSSGYSYRVELKPRNDAWFLILNTLVAFSFLVISGLVWYGSTQNSDRYFSVSGLLFGYIIAMGWSGMQLPAYISALLVVLYFICYPQAFMTLLYFSYQFPQQTISQKGLEIRKRVIQFIGLSISCLLMALYAKKTIQSTPD